jgi:polysaccharide pyruvyl transferase WcaK-like protein
VTIRAALWGNFGTRNFGNECTLHAMLDSARRHLPADAECLVVCNGPADTTARHGVSAVPIAPSFPTGRETSPQMLRSLLRLSRELWDWVRVVRIMRLVDLLVMTGTGMITDKHEGALGTPYQLFKWVAAARLCRKEVQFVSVGVEDLVSRVPVRLLSWSLRLAHYRSYRDSASRDRATQTLRCDPKDPIFPDLAFSLPRSFETKDPAAAKSGRTVAVGIYAVEAGAAATVAYVQSVGTFVLWLLDSGYRVSIVIGDADYDQQVRDELSGWLGERGALDRVVNEPATSFEELMGQLASADFVVATRFHNLVLALLLRKPVVSISHMDKNDELMDMFGLSRYRLTMADAQSTRLVEVFELLEVNADPLRRLIDDRAEDFRTKLERQYATVFEKWSFGPSKS